MTGILVAVVLGILPGAWFGFGWPSRALDVISRFGLSIALSPFVVSFQAALLQAAGFSGRPAAFGILIVNLFAAAIIAYRLRETEWFDDRGTVGWVLLSAVVPVAWLLTLWSATPGLRIFGWHNLLHVDIVYQLLRPPLLPEEPALAGIPLSYAWFGHGSRMVIGLVADRPPTSLFPIGNILALLAVVILVFKAGRFLGLAQPLAGLAATLSVLGGNLARDVTELVATGEAGEIFRLLGDPRLRLPLEKFLYLDLMPESLAILAGVLLLSLLAMKTGQISLATMVVISLSALAATYAVALPVGCAVTVSLGLCALVSSPGGPGEGARRGLPLMAGALLVGLVFGLWLWWNGGPSIAAPRESAGIPIAAWYGFLAVAPFVLMSLPAVVRGIRRRDPAVQGLALTVVILMGIYALIEVRALEYKYIHYSRTCLALLTAMTLGHWCRSWKRRQWVLPAAIVSALAGVSLVTTLAQPPPSLGQAPPLLEQHFQLSLDSRSPHEGWTMAVRKETPLDTVLVARGLEFHAGVFANRSSYFPCERDGRKTAGYTLMHQGHLLEYRKYPVSVYRTRENTIRQLYSASSPALLMQEIRSLQSLGRPLAIVLGPGDGRLLAWLGQQGVGRLLYSDEQQAVWFMGTDQGRRASHVK